MIAKRIYVNQDTDFVLERTDLSADELEIIVGRFNRNSSRCGELRGEYIEYMDGRREIVHHFTKKVLWKEPADA